MMTMTSWMAGMWWLLAAGVEPSPTEVGPDEPAVTPPAEAGADESLVAPPPTAAPEDGTEPVAPPPEPVPPVGSVDADPEPDPDDVPPASLPRTASSPPEESEPRAQGGALHTPLPPAPDAEEPSTLLGEGPWRGRGWLGLGLSVSVPLGGRPPAAGTVVAAAGELMLGWRLHRAVGLHTAISTVAHDAGRRTVVASDGTNFEEVAYGRLTAFDLVTARAFLPRFRRVDPWAELGVGVGIYRDAFGEQRRAVGLARTGIGVDFWLAPTFTLGVMSAYRMAIIDKDVGHGFRAGADLGIHW